MILVEIFGDHKEGTLYKDKLWTRKKHQIWVWGSLLDISYSVDNYLIAMRETSAQPRMGIQAVADNRREDWEPALGDCPEDDLLKFSGAAARMGGFSSNMESNNIKKLNYRQLKKKDQFGRDSSEGLQNPWIWWTNLSVMTSPTVQLSYFTQISNVQYI